MALLLTLKVNIYINERDIEAAASIHDVLFVFVLKISVYTCVMFVCVIGANSNLFYKETDVGSPM